MISNQLRDRKSHSHETQTSNNPEDCCIQRIQIITHKWRPDVGIDLSPFRRSYLSASEQKHLQRRQHRISVPPTAPTPIASPMKASLDRNGLSSGGAVVEASAKNLRPGFFLLLLTLCFFSCFSVLQRTSPVVLINAYIF